MGYRLSNIGGQIFVILCLVYAQHVLANESGKKSIYSPSKVIYDFSHSNPEMLSHMLDRASLLQKIYQNDVFEASIVFIIHEGAVPLFTKAPKDSNSELMVRARSLTQGEIIQFRVCEASALMQGFKSHDMQDFVSMVPMADAEIVKLQLQGYAYLR